MKARQQLRNYPRSRKPRAGLAPLELVLALPLMLCVMALMVNFGNAASWKVRTATGARLAAWRARPLWGATDDPKPSNLWPTSATIAALGTSRIPQVDTAWNQPAIVQGWIKGPVFMAQNGYIVVRDKRFNEMSEGIGKGDGNVSMKYPFMPGLGNMSLHGDHTLAQTVWQFHSMGYGLNTQRRAKGWWNLEDNPDWASQRQRFLDGDEKMRTNPRRELLKPLDREPDLFPSRWGTYQFDFYPKAPVICVNDPSIVLTNISAEGGLLDQIRGTNGSTGVTLTMATTYYRRYKLELDYWVPPPDSMAPPPAEVPPPGRVGELKQWVAELEQLIDALKQNNG